MKRTAFYRTILTLLGALIVTISGIGIGAQPVHAQITIDPTQPNCFNPSGTAAYTKVDCDATVLFFYGQPMNAGSCYIVSGSTTAVSISVTEAQCSDVTGQAATAQKNIQAAAASQNSQATASSLGRNATNSCDGSTPDKLQQCLKQNQLVTTFQDVINVLGVGVGVLVVIMIIIGGIQYASAGSNPQAVSAAKKRIMNAVIALVAFMLLYSFLQWLLPGGLF